MATADRGGRLKDMGSYPRGSGRLGLPVDIADKDSMVTIWVGVTVGCEVAVPVEPLERR